MLKKSRPWQDEGGERKQCVNTQPKQARGAEWVLPSKNACGYLTGTLQLPAQDTLPGQDD